MVNVGCLLKARVLHKLSLAAAAVAVGPDGYCSRAVASDMGRHSVPSIPRETQSVP